MDNKNHLGCSKHHPEKIIFWEDKYSDAIGWIVIDTLISGIAGGGIFLHPDATLEEASDLAKSMSYKNSLNSPIFGGAKGGIRFNHKDPYATEVLRRFLMDNHPIIENVWYTGADLNTRNPLINKIIQEDLGLPTPFACLGKKISSLLDIPSQSEVIASRIETPLNTYFTLGDGSTGYSVAASIRLLAPLNRKISIQGFGNVGKSLAYFLQEFQIGTVVGIIEQEGYLYNKEGINIQDLLKMKKSEDFTLGCFQDFANIYHDKGYQWISRPPKESEEDFLCKFLAHSEPDIFSPCAKRYSLTQRVINTLASSSLQRFIICGANNAFESDSVIKNTLKKNIITIPEWVSNSGNALLFVEALKKTSWSQNSPHEILKIIDTRVQEFLKDSQKQSIEKGIPDLYDACYATALDKIDAAL